MLSEKFEAAVRWGKLLLCVMLGAFAIWRGHEYSDPRGNYDMLVPVMCCLFAMCLFGLALGILFRDQEDAEVQ